VTVTQELEMFYMPICNQVTLNLTLTLILIQLLTWHFGHHCYKWRVGVWSKRRQIETATGPK